MRVSLNDTLLVWCIVSKGLLCMALCFPACQIACCSGYLFRHSVCRGIAMTGNTDSRPSLIMLFAVLLLARSSSWYMDTCKHEGGGT